MSPPPDSGSSRMNYSSGHPPFKLLKELVKPREKPTAPKKEAGML